MKTQIVGLLYIGSVLQPLGVKAWLSVSPSQATVPRGTEVRGGFAKGMMNLWTMHDSTEPAEAISYRTQFFVGGHNSLIVSHCPCPAF